MLGNFIRETTTTTGTGNLTVSSVSGYPTCNLVFGTNRRFYYAILDDATAQPIEIGRGYLSASTTLVRETPLASFVSGTYDDTSPSAVSLAAGTKRVICAIEASALQTGIVTVASGVTGGSYKRGPHNGLFSGSAPAASYTLTKDRQVYVPICINLDATIASVRMQWGATGGTGGTRGVHMGIYDSLASGGPGARLYESGDIAGTAYADMAFTLGTAARLLPGWYWLACVADYTANLSVYRSFGGPSPLGWDVGSGPQAVIALTENLSASWANMPATASTTPAPVVGQSFCPFMGVVLA